MTNNNLLIGTIGTTLSFIGTAIQTNEILQTISIIITWSSAKKFNFNWFYNFSLIK